VCEHNAKGERHLQDLGEAMVDAHQPGKGYEAIFKQAENIQDNCQSFQEWSFQQVHPKVKLCNALRNCKKLGNKLES